MRVSVTLPVSDPRHTAAAVAGLEGSGFAGAYTFESSHDPFLPLAAAAGATRTLRLGTAVAIGFARNPMVLAHAGHDLQLMSEGRFELGLGSQIRPHIEKRFSETWSHPARRMREMVLAVRAIWEAWQAGGALDFRGEFYSHTLMTPFFDPGPNPYGPPPILVGGFGPRMVGVAGEVADGLVVHPFTTRRSLEELTLPALDAGLDRGGRPGPTSTSCGSRSSSRGPTTRSGGPTWRSPGRSSRSTARRPPTGPPSTCTAGATCSPSSTPCRSRAGGTAWPSSSPTSGSTSSPWSAPSTS